MTYSEELRRASRVLAEAVDDLLSTSNPSLTIRFAFRRNILEQASNAVRLALAANDHPVRNHQPPDGNPFSDLPLVHVVPAKGAT